jgi:hypothetical protein
MNEQTENNEQEQPNSSEFEIWRDAMIKEFKETQDRLSAMRKDTLEKLSNNEVPLDLHNRL